MLLGLFAVWTVLVCTVDVQAAGESVTPVGFAALNTWFHGLWGVHLWVYTLTDWLGLVPVFVCMVFGCVGLSQLLRRRSLRKVDRDILILGVYYVAVILCYLTFEMYPINYRPILIDGRMEASYPSSTVLLVLSVMPTLVWQVRRRVKKSLLRRVMTALAMLFALVMTVGRLVSGVHWLTDIVGGALLSGGLFSLYRAAAEEH